MFDSTLHTSYTPLRTTQQHTTRIHSLSPTQHRLVGDQVGVSGEQHPRKRELAVECGSQRLLSVLLDTLLLDGWVACVWWEVRES
jgi:hypothetical protein